MLYAWVDDQKRAPFAKGERTTCRDCGGSDLHWKRDHGWVTGSWRWLRCRRCGNAVHLSVPTWTIALYLIAAAAAVWGILSVVR